MKQPGYRPARPEDMAWAYTLFRAGMKPYIEQTWGWDEVFQRHSFMENIPYSVFTIITLAERDAGGYCLRHHKRSHLELELLVIDADLRNAGLGTRVMQDLMQEARQRELPLQLNVLRVNPAVKFYERLGFTILQSDSERYRLSWPK